MGGVYYVCIHYGVLVNNFPSVARGFLAALYRIVLWGVYRMSAGALMALKRSSLGDLRYASRGMCLERITHGHDVRLGLVG